MNYVDGFVVPVPVKNLPAYWRVSRAMAKIWREYGALAYVECAADDAKMGKLTSFPQSVKLSPARSSCSRGSSTSRALSVTASTPRR